MEKWFSDISPIMDIEHDCILSKKGDISIVFKVILPEIFTMFDNDFEMIHQGLIKAIKVLPKECIFHKQDWYIRSTYQAEAVTSGDSFLSQSSERHFAGRAFMRHESYIIITKKPVGRKQSSSVFSSLLRPSVVPSEVLKMDALREMEDSAGQFQVILNGSGLVLERMRADELASGPGRIGFVERYFSLSEDPDNLVIKDLELKPDFRIGDQYCQLYTLADTEHLPAMCGSRITYDKYSTDRTKFPVGFSSTIALLLNCNHIYNQYIFIGDAQAVVKKFEGKRLRLQSLAAYSRENAIARDAINDFLNECISEQRLPVRAHFNILVWGNSPSHLQDCKNLVTAGLAQMEATVKLETAGAPQIWWAGIPGNAADFPMNDTFDTFAEQACTFLAIETNYRSTKPNEGIRFCDRLNSKPVYADFFHRPRFEGVTANMGTLVCGSSGGGKSMTVNHILRSLYDQGAHCVIIDIGGSYRGLCELVGGYYFTYEESNPISFNPFYLAEGDFLDTEKKESLKALLIALWKQEGDAVSRAEYVALSVALDGYFDDLAHDKGIFPCFNSFYEYLESKYVGLLKSQRVKDKDFDIDNFLYVLRPYFKGGEFDYLLNSESKVNLLKERFVVVELDNIKGHMILFPVVTMMVMEMFISKLRKLGSALKVLAVDEAWQPIARAGMASFLQFGYKAFRKYNAIPIVITQEIDDLLSSPIIKETIIANSDVKILMDMRKFINKFDHVQETLGMSEKGKAILLSVNKENREIFVDLGGKVMKVFKNELCPEEYYAYTTEGNERVRVRELSAEYGSMQLGIEALIKQKRNGA